MSTTSLLDDLYTRTVGSKASSSSSRSSGSGSFPADPPSPGDILVHPQDVFTPRKKSSTASASAAAYREPHPEIAIHSDDTEPEASHQQQQAQSDPFDPFDYPSSDPVPLPEPSDVQWTYANTGLGMSTLGIFTQGGSHTNTTSTSASSSASSVGALSPDLRTSFGASSSFMPGVGDVFDDYGLSAFASPPLHQFPQPASADDSCATILPDWTTSTTTTTTIPQTVAEIQEGRRAAAAHHFNKGDLYPPYQHHHLQQPPHRSATPLGFNDFVDPGTNFLDGLTFDSPVRPHAQPPPPPQQQQQQQQQPLQARNAWSDPMPQSQWNAQKSLRSVKSAGDLKSRTRSQQHWPSFAFPTSYMAPAPTAPTATASNNTTKQVVSAAATNASTAAARRDVGPLDAPTPAATLASPFIPQQPVSPALSCASPRSPQKKHFLDKDLTAHLASPRRSGSSQSSAQGSSSSEWQQPTTPLTPRFDPALSPAPMYYMPPPLPMSPSQMSMPSPSQAQLRSPLNAIEGFENVNTDFLNYDPTIYNTSPTKPRRALNRKRSRQDLEADDFHAPPPSQPLASDHGSDFDCPSESESVVSDFADGDWAPRAHSHFFSPQASPTKPRAVSQTHHQTIRRVKSAPKLRQQQQQQQQQEPMAAGPAPQDILQSLPRDILSSDDGAQGASSLPKTVIQSLYQNVPSAPGERGRRYQCLIEGCGRVFPRKSAIETHIQTHLEDKPFVCPDPDCDAAFVRQHDLRRHERIHSGNKPFPCPCGKGFARGDALTRHRQRGICIGSTVPRR